MNKQITSIQVLGSGCPTCKKLFELTQKAVAELGLKTEVEYVTDIQKIIELGVMSSPVLTINGKVALVGQLPTSEKIKELITSGNEPITA
jgi:small redox-active disulfide protein 2